MSSFDQFDLLPTLKITLKELRLTKPTEIQIKTIGPILANKNIVGVSETGSGKTLAFVLPLLHQLKSLEASGDARC